MSLQMRTSRIYLPCFSHFNWSKRILLCLWFVLTINLKASVVHVNRYLHLSVPCIKILIESNSLVGLYFIFASNSTFVLIKYLRCLLLNYHMNVHGFFRFFLDSLLFLIWLVISDWHSMYRPIWLVSLVFGSVSILMILAGILPYMPYSSRSLNDLKTASVTKEDC